MDLGHVYRSKSLKVVRRTSTMRMSVDFAAPKDSVFVSVLIGVEPEGVKAGDPQFVDLVTRLNEFGWEERLPEGKPGWYWALYDREGLDEYDQLGVVHCIVNAKEALVPSDSRFSIKVLGPRVFEWNPISENQAAQQESSPKKKKTSKKTTKRKRS